MSERLTDEELATFIQWSETQAEVVSGGDFFVLFMQEVPRPLRELRDLRTAVREHLSTHNEQCPCANKLRALVAEKP